MRKLDILGTLMMVVGNIALMITVVILLTVDYHMDVWHITALVTGISGIITTTLSYIIALIIGGENESN